MNPMTPVVRRGKKMDVRQEEIRDAQFVLVYLVHDVISAHVVYDFFRNIIAEVPAAQSIMLPETEGAVRRMFISSLLLSLCKFFEFFDRYKAVIPANCVPRCEAVYRELDRRKIKNLRNKFIGHVLNKKTNRPLSADEIDAAFNAATGDDVHAFLKWVHGPNGGSAQTIVALLQEVHSALSVASGTSRAVSAPPGSPAETR